MPIFPFQKRPRSGENGPRMRPARLGQTNESAAPHFSRMGGMRDANANPISGAMPAPSNTATPGSMPVPGVARNARVAVAAPVPPPPPGSAASSLLKRYRPLETRAAGGFGSVEICLDKRLQRRVAIKRMPLASPYNRTSLETTAAAIAEARTASMLQDPHIVSVIDFVYDSAYAYLVMEYVDGMSLQEFLEHVEGNSLTYDECACIADALAQALAHAHDNGVLHLDIKPANVLIDRSGHVKLADFGMATLTSAAGFGGSRGGTIGYMPPEQLLGEAVDERTDIFSLACVLYEALCAATPFRAGTPADSLANIERGVIAPSDFLPDIPENTEQALLCALSAEPDGRMTNVQAFADGFLTQLGDTREGRRSLSRMIARLTSDEVEEGAEETHTVWELDPAEGYLGSRSPRARSLAVAGASGLAVAASCWMMLGAFGVAAPFARAVAALGIGAAAGAAPQIGSALLGAGLLAAFLQNGGDAVALVLGVAILFASVSAWWLVWGRTPAASATVALTCALALATGPEAAPLMGAAATACAGYFLAPQAALASTAFSVLFATAAAGSVAAGGPGALAGAALALQAPGPFVAAAVFGAAAAGVSAVLQRTWQHYLDARGTGLATVAYLLPVAAALAALCLAHPMEIAALPGALVATAAGAGTLSSILVWICVYALGYRKDQPEGDRP